MEHHREDDPVIDSDNDMTVPTTGSEGPGELTEVDHEADDEAKAHQSVAPAGNSGLESTEMPPPFGSNHLDAASGDLDDSR
jgi:hypothetical protein